METLGQRIAYLKGLAEGMNVTASSNEGKLLVAIIDLLDDMCDSISDLESNHDDLNEYVESIDQDVHELEGFVYGSDDDDDDDDFDDEDDDDDDDFDDEDTEFIEVECPNCHETVYFDEEVFGEDDDVICPSCNKTVIVDDSEND